MRATLAPRQIILQQIDILLERLDVGPVRFFREPAPQRLKRPDIADAGLLFQNGVDIADHAQRFGRIERGALREFDQDVDRVGAGQLGVEAMARLHSLFLVGHLVGEPIARLQLRVADRQDDDDEQPDQ